ncbi:hypothetical protein V9K92_00825 [Phyllobacterium sp. CCNWLW109]
MGSSPAEQRNASCSSRWVADKPPATPEPEAHASLRVALVAIFNAVFNKA